MKSNSFMSRGFDIGNNAIVWTFKSGKTLEFRIRAQLPGESDNDYQAMKHGYTQKIADAAAAFKTEAEKYDAMADVIETLQSGEWNGGRAAGSGNVSMLVRALAIVMPTKSAETIKTFVAGLTAEQKTAMLGTKKVAAAVAKINAEKTKDVDVDALFSDLDAI